MSILEGEIDTMHTALGNISPRELFTAMIKFVSELEAPGSAHPYNLYNSILATWLVSRDELIRIGAIKKTINKSTRREVYERDCRKCIYCGSTNNLSIHHRLPVRYGGTNNLDNLELVCGRSKRDSCHITRAKHLRFVTNIDDVERLAKYMKRLATR